MRVHVMYVLWQRPSFALWSRSCGCGDHQYPWDTEQLSTNASLKMGDNSNKCSPSWVQDMFWSEDTDILITEACHSADREVWLNSNRHSRTGFYAGIEESGQFRALLGYHGLSKDKTSFFSAPSFVSNSYSDAIVENWILEMYDSSWKISGTKRRSVLQPSSLARRIPSSTTLLKTVDSRTARTRATSLVHPIITSEIATPIVLRLCPKAPKHSTSKHIE